MILALKMMKSLITKQIIQLHNTTIINLIIKNLELKYTNKITKKLFNTFSMLYHYYLVFLFI